LGAAINPTILECITLYHIGGVFMAKDKKTSPKVAPKTSPKVAKKASPAAKSVSGAKGKKK
jgi:hypothetical protein